MSVSDPPEEPEAAVLPEESAGPVAPDEAGAGGPDGAGVAEPPAAQGAEVTHANQLRGLKFKQLLNRPLTWVWIGLGGLAVAAFCGWMFGPVWALLGLALGVLGGLLTTFWVADERAEDAFHEAFAKARGLTWTEGGDLEQVVPFLRKGDEQRADDIFEGELAPGLTGKLVLYTYTEVTYNHKGQRQESDYPFTVVLTEVPEIVRQMPELLVRRKAGFKALEKLEDAFRANHERVTLESEAMRDRYEIFVTKQQDPVFVRRLFSPSFIVWLTESPPDRFWFELVNGNLCAIVPQHRDDIAGFDEMIAVTAEIADRVRGEAAGT